jgi:hypothetical protein
MNETVGRDAASQSMVLFRTKWSHSGRSGVEIAEILDIVSGFREEIGQLKCI